MAEKKKKSGVKIEGNGEGTANETPKDKNYIVVPVGDVALVQCSDEKAAARLVAADAGYSGKLLVVEADFVEIVAASHRVEIKSESMDDFVKAATAPEAAAE